MSSMMMVSPCLINFPLFFLSVSNFRLCFYPKFLLLFCLIDIYSGAVVTVSFGRPEASFNESDGEYRMCIVKDRDTAQRVTVELTDTPGTAGRNEGKFHHTHTHTHTPCTISCSKVYTHIHSIYYSDYRSVRLRLISIEPEESMTCFDGVIIDDILGGEGIEFFTLNIPEPTQPGVNVGLDETTINIIDDDGQTL